MEEYKQQRDLSDELNVSEIPDAIQDDKELADTVKIDQEDMEEYIQAMN